MAPPPLSATEAALEGQRFGRLQLRVALLCALAQAFDGYDLNAIGMAAPSLSHAWGLPAADFTTAFVMSSVGILVGAVASGPAGDRLGRKPVLIASLLLLGIASLLSAFAGSLAMLTVLRFFTGIGIGGAMPTTVALTSDYTPHRHRASIIMFMFTGNPVGGFLGGQLVAQLLPVFGWPVIFLIGGVAPLLLVPVLLLWLPESPRFLLAKSRPSLRDLHVLRRLSLAPAAASGVDLAAGNPVAALFAEGYASRTLLLWVMFFANLLSLFLLSYWLPSILHLSGFTPADAVFGASMLSAGGILSTLLLGPLSTRLGAERVLLASFAAGALFIAAISLLDLPRIPLLAAIFCAGGCIIGSQLAANGLAAALYPARMRTTGVGWALGVGRLGGIAGPALGGMLLGLGWPPRQIFLGICLTAVIAAACAGLLGMRAVRAGGVRKRPDARHPAT
ncbi:MAG: MFS transporter [Stellaceae bacterium]